MDTAGELRARRTSIKLSFQLHHFTMRPTDAIDALMVQAVLLDDLAAPDDDGRDINVVPHHLLREMKAERWPSLVRKMCVRNAG